MKYRLLKNRNLVEDKEFLNKNKWFVGYDKENRAEILEFEIPDTLNNYAKKINFDLGTEKVSDILNQDNTYILKNNITQYKQVSFYLEFIKEIDNNTTEILKTEVKTIEFGDSFDVNTEITEEEISIIDTLIAQTNSAINRANAISQDLENKVATDYYRGATGEKGDKGDKGDTGERGPQGIQGVQGAKGETGAKGDKGDKGDTGSQGPQGLKGDTGSAGADAKINGVNTLSIEAGTNITLNQEGSTLTINSTGGSGGTSDYSDLTNKPSINNVTLSGNKTISDLGLGTYSKPNGGIPSTDLASAVQTSLGKADTALQEHQDISGKQDIEDNTLTTNNKTVPSAINEVNSIAKGANQALSYGNYSTMVTAFNSLDDDVYNVGQNIYIITTEVPDLWISGVESTSSTYAYVDDATIVSALETNGYIQVGYYKLSMLETQKVDLTDYVKNTDYATAEKGGTIRISNASALGISNGNLYAVVKAYNTYNSASGNMFIGKGTLENVITGKGLVSNTDYATYSNGGVIKVDGSFSTFITDGKLKCTLKTYGDYQNLSSYAFIGKGTLENVVAGKELDLKQLSTFDNTKTQVLKNINGTLTWVDES